MTLTMSDGPLSTAPAPSNYRIDGPAHRIYVHDVPKRIRIEFAGEMVADSTRARMLHESNILPVLYLPMADVRSAVVEPTAHRTHCPFKGDASYWTLRVGDRVADNALWGYRTPKSEVAVITDHVAFFLDKIDAVWEEEERLDAHPRDPFHRVDVRRSGRHVVVRHGDRVLADSTAPKAVFETGLPARWYIPRGDVDTGVLTGSDTRTVCPYKGVARWWSLVDGPEDSAWSYDEPFSDGRGLEDHLCFSGDGITTEVDGVRA